MHLLAGNYPVYLVVLGLVAAFLVLRLRSVLGKRTGLERPVERPMEPVPGPRARSRGPILDTKAEPVVPAPRRELPDVNSAAGMALNRMREQDRDFDPRGFLDGAEGAFRRIVQAYAQGDRVVLRQALTSDAFAAFEAAITAREAAGERQQAEIRAVTLLQITEATLAEEGGLWRGGIEVRIVSDQISMVSNRNGEPISGADAVTELADSWLFERLLGAGRTTDKKDESGFGWRLAAARSA